MLKIFKKKNNNIENNIDIDKKINKYRSNKKDRLIVSKQYSVPIDSKNTNVCLVGAAGSGKTYNFVLPNLMQANSSYLVADRFTDMYKKTAPYLESNGYEVNLLDLSFADKTDNTNYKCDKYNPFEYLYSVGDIETLANVIVRNTGCKKAIPEYKELAASSLLALIMSFVRFYLPKEDQNFQTVLKLLTEGKESGYIKDIESLNIADTGIVNPDEDIKNYTFYKNKSFKTAVGKNRKAIYSSCLDRLQIFKNPPVAEITSEDTLELDKLGDRKTALFVNLFERTSGLDLIVAMLYSQAMDVLANYAETTAEFSQLVIDGNGNVIKTFRAENNENAELANKKASWFLYKCKSAVIVENSELNRFEAKTKEDELVLFRKNQKDAITALDNLNKHGKVIANKDKNCGGTKLPIPVRMFTKEFYRIGIIPKILLNMHRFVGRNLSIVLSIHDIDVLEDKYKYEYKEIIDCCSILIAIGGVSPEGQKVFYNIAKKEKDAGAVSLYDLKKDSIHQIYYDQCYGIIRGGLIFLDNKSNPKEHSAYCSVHELANLDDF